MKKSLFAITLVCSMSSANAANLLLNPSFENVPNGATGQALMPTDWQAVTVTPDTYSNDGSYGLSPSGFSNFTGAAAQDGKRWVAGWANPSYHETFGQTLSSTLQANQQYSLSAYLLQAKRPDLDVSGGYDVYLTTDASRDLASGVLLGSLGPTTDSNDWEFSSFSFYAPTNASLLDFILFRPFNAVGVTGGNAYPGLDNLNLSATVSAVPVPAAAFMFAPALLGFIGLRRRAKQNAA